MNHADKAKNNNTIMEVAPEDYLHDTIDRLDPSYTLQLNEQHRKTILRTLFFSHSNSKANNHHNDKIEFDKLIKNTRAQMQWKEMIRFISHDLQMYLNNNGKKEVVDKLHQKAPHFQVGMDKVLNNANNKLESEFASPTKLSSFLARGKSYKGKLELLLQDIQQESSLLDKYQQILAVESTCVNDTTLLSHMMDRYNMEDKSQREQILKYAQLEFPKDPRQQQQHTGEDDFSFDSGLAIGKQSETSLLHYLNRHRLPQIIQNEQGYEEAQQQQHPFIDVASNDNDNDSNNNIILLNNVNVNPPNKFKDYKRKCRNGSKNKNNARYWIESSEAFENHNTSSDVFISTEFDAMVLKILTPKDLEKNDTSIFGGGNTNHDWIIQILEIWDAKATVHPVTIEDVFVKKLKSIQRILNDPNARLCCLVYNGDNDNAVPVIQKYPIITSTTRSSSSLSSGNPEDLHEQVQQQLQFCESTTTTKPSSSASEPSSSSLTMGIFGTSILPPLIAARRIQRVLSEQMLLDKNAILRANNNNNSGTMSIPTPCTETVVIPRIQKLLQIQTQKMIRTKIIVKVCE